MVNKILYILLALLVFGFLILIHELGHYFFARLFKVSIKEFAIGMGPKLLSRTSKKTGIAYSLRALPIGGFVSMVGEDEESDDENALNKKPVWQRIIIVAAGAVMNLAVGIIVMCMLVISADSLPSNYVALVPEGSIAEAGGLEVGDVIVKVDGTPTHIANEVLYEIMRKGTKPIDIVVERNGETVVLSDFNFATMEEQGVVFGDVDFKVAVEEKNFVNVVKHSFFRSTMTVKMIWESLLDLITGRYGLQQLSGPIGVTDALGDAAKQSFSSFVYLSVIISMNLGVMNLMPLPALDGGRLFFLLVEAVRGKPVKPEFEGYVHFAGIVILMIFMVIITCKDIVSLLSGFLGK